MAWIGDIVRSPDSHRTLADQLEKLMEMPERVTREDLRKAVSALRAAADDTKTLMNYQQPGCPCRRIEDDNYSRIIYIKECQHHGHLLREVERIETAYKAAEQKLKDGVRLTFMAEALGGLADFSRAASETGRRARELANAAIAALLE
jgi:hypothetical protein